MCRMQIAMEWVATLLGPLLGLTLVLFLQLSGTQATGQWLSSYPDPLPSCSKVPGGIPGWDCYDPPNHPLPPCDFDHQRIGFDCSGWPPLSHVGNASPTTFKSKTRPVLEQHIAIDLPPCNVVSDDGTDSWKCYDTRTWPHAVGGGHAGKASQAGTVKSETTEEKGGHVEAELPVCSQVPGGIPGWDCYDPPNHPLLPCDFHHQRIGFDCWGWPPAVGSDHAGEASEAAATGKSQTTPQEKGGHVLAALPPCREVPGGIPGVKCYDPPTHPFLPCDPKHPLPGLDCSRWPPAAAH